MTGTNRSAAALVLGAAGAMVALLPAPVAADSSDRDDGAPRAAPLVNIAIDAPAAGSSELPGHEAALATDGDGATAWCPDGPSGTLTIDLGRPRLVAGVGLTLLGSDARAAVSLEFATAPERFREARPSGSFETGITTWQGAGRPDGDPVRYARVGIAGTQAGGVCVGELRVLARSRDAASILVGGDLSFAVQEAAAGNTYADRGAAGLPEHILASHGWNWIRLRIWTDPPGGYSDLASVLEMARRAHAAGMKILIDFHYSDFWADPQKQPTPAAWAGQDLPALAQTVHDYTRDVLAALHRQGTPAEMVQIGNEIRNGMLWPIGYIDWTTGSGWDNLGALLRAGVAGAAAAPGPRPRIMIHFDQGGDNGFSRAFFDRILAERVPFDVIGLSYYPFWHGTLTQLRANMGDLAVRYGKDVMLAETQYAWTLANGDGLGNFLWQESMLVPGYPASPGGQLAFESDLLSALAAVPARRGAGIFYWQPEWIPGVGWQPGDGTPNDNLTMFDFAGRALPAVESRDPLLACRQYAPGEAPCTF